MAGLAATRAYLREEATTLARDLGLASSNLDGLAEAERVGSQSRQEIATALVSTRSKADQVRALRNDLLGGEAVTVHRARYESAAQDARDEAAEARTASAVARSEVRSAERAFAEAIVVADARRTVHEKASRAVAAERNRIGMSAEQVTELLAITTEKVEELRSTVNSFAEAFRIAAGLLATRREDLERVARDAPGTPLPDDASDRLAFLEDTVGERNWLIGVLEDRLRRDAGERGKVEALRDEMDLAAADHATWSDVDGVIGSANGAAFRQHAQEITLEALVALANEQLGMISPRYRLTQETPCRCTWPIWTWVARCGPPGACPGARGSSFRSASPWLCQGWRGARARATCSSSTRASDRSTPAAWTSPWKLWRPCKASAARSAWSPTSRPWWSASPPRSGWSNGEAAGASLRSRQREAADGYLVPKISKPFCARVIATYMFSCRHHSQPMD